MNEDYCYKPNPCYDSNSFGFDQVQPPQYPVIHQSPQQTSVEILQAKEDLMISIENFLNKFNRISFRGTPKVLLLAWEKFFEIKHREKQHPPEDIQELIRKLLEDVQNISEELAEYINSPSWNRPAFYFDDYEDDTIAITPVLSIEEPVDSLIIEDEHLDAIPATKSDEVIKSSVENLIPILSESEGIPDSVCDVPLCNNPTLLEAFKEHSEFVIDFNDDSTSSDDDSPYGEDIDYVDASPPDSELVSLKVVENVTSEDGEIEDDSPSTFPNLFLEETNTFDNSLPESETFCFDLEENSSGSTTTRSDYSLPDYEAFYLNDDHIEEKSSGNTTTHADFSQYD
ncbi:hypothetical protein Tco_1026588 [Tanacetum coccineum]